MNENIFAAFASAATAAKQRLFIEDGNTAYDYAAMLEESAKAASALLATGASRGDRVLVQVEKTVPAVFLYLGCLRAGLVFIPLNTAYTADEVAYFLTDAEPSLFIGGQYALNRLTEGGHLPAGLRTLTLEADGSGSFAQALTQSTPDTSIAEAKAGTVAAILYTSGTTGRSKGAMLTHGNLLSNVAALDELWRWQEDDLLVHALPIFHAHGLFVALHLSLYRATPMLFHAKFDADAVLADLARATVFMGVPTFYVRLLKHDGFTRAHVCHMRLFISGSAPLTEPVFEAFAARTGHRILERYGMTEALMITSNPYDGDRVAGSVGYPLPGVSVRLAVDGEPGQPGVLEITGPNVFMGYWRQPEKTRDAFTDDGWFRTGDIASIDASGRVRLVGRGTDLIISGGYNVYPKEIELLIDEMPGIDETAVIGVPHPDFGEAVVAVVVGQQGHATQPDSILQSLRGRIAPFKLPKQVVPVDALPRNAMGKVEKAALRRQYADLFG